MIKATMITNQGAIALIGISDENVQRMKAGMPLDINLVELSPPGGHIDRVVIHQAHTYGEVLSDWEDGGVPVTQHMHNTAHELDQQLARERRDRRGHR